MLTMPNLSDATITLRAFADADVDLVLEAAADPYIPLITAVPAAGGPVAASEFIARQHQRAESGQGYSFAVSLSGSNRAVGQLGVWLRDLDFGRVSIGYWIAGSARGNGYATRALSMAARWVGARADVHRIELYVEPWNVGSWRSAERAGFEREGLLRNWQAVGGEQRDMYMYALSPAR